jgi:hypothetical protein
MGLRERDVGNIELGRTRATSPTPRPRQSLERAKKIRPVRMNPIVVVQMNHLLIVRGHALVVVPLVIINSRETMDLLELR